MMRSIVGAALATLLFAARTHAQGPPVGPPAPKAPAPEPAPCPIGRGSAIAELGCEVGRALRAAPPTALVVAAPVTGDTKPSDSAALGARIASVLAGAIGAKSSSEPATLGRARSLAAKVGTLIHVVPELVKGELRVTVDVYPVPRSFWDRVRDPEPSPSMHAFASRRLDAELRTFLPPIPLVAQRTDKATTNEPNPVALACGDIDGDGALELVLVGRLRVQIGRLRSGRFQVAHAASWSELSPLSRSPLREPIASAAIETGRWVDVGSSDRLDAVRLDATLGPSALLGHRLPWPGGGCAKIQGLGIRPEIESCATGDAAPASTRLDKPADALAGSVVTRPRGDVRSVRAERLFNEARAVLRDDTGRTAELAGAGAQLAVGDLDADGQPELLSSTDTLDPSGDALLLHTWRDDGRLTERLRIAVPGGVRALAVCPPDGPGLAPIALATSGEIWVMR